VFDLAARSLVANAQRLQFRQHLSASLQPIAAIDRAAESVEHFSAVNAVRWMMAVGA